jgi:hypothetical protein
VCRRRPRRGRARPTRPAAQLAQFRALPARAASSTGNSLIGWRCRSLHIVVGGPGVADAKNGIAGGGRDCLGARQ